MNKFYIPVDETAYLELPCRDFIFESFFTENFTDDLERVEYKFLPFSLYTDYKVYVKCQILYFLYLNQHRQFTRQQIANPIISFLMEHPTLKELTGLKQFCRNAVGHLAENFTILSRKHNKTQLNEYYFNPAYERLFCYGLFWNRRFIREQLEKIKFFHINRIFKFVKVLDFIGNKKVSVKQIANSCLFGHIETFIRKVLIPLVKLNLVKRFKEKGRWIYQLTSPNSHDIL